MPLTSLKTGVAAALLVAFSLPASAETFKLTTLEWPPYVMADGSGPSTDAVKAAFAKAGHTADATVFPWNRAVKMAAEDPAWIGVFPEYYSADADAEKGGSRCLFSKSFGVSPVGFVQLATKPITWKTHEDLKAYKIGVVRGYNNEEQFDAMVAKGEIKVDEAESDSQNILKAAGGRTDAAVVDRLVFEHLAKTDPQVAAVAGKLTFNEVLLKEHGLHVCFKNSDAGRAARDAFNSGL
ncbi:transporter substrate-binding domain-containing protein [Microvirga tunisiensis]|uniref:Transporter substrate-binding domain-containing protein n=2 Tax=Pannonibacter tanglangensis TaxID=2750084 RepID=A0ABW9ZEP5_9HYPH|nr:MULTISPECIES: ABC transporter substrate-binding protein [unclassified Pannonibacter]NBN63305.1 transporter substrate-binding domain-containing protein [Pannonibacter sp. XCT-34]NBN76944.1 transporter substrate-binding domain-containing protein [Pannonibacter sp. XCT-53]